MPEYDHSYKLLFNHPEMVADLLRGFVKEPWVAELDLGTLERVNGSYVSDDLREREDDAIWRVRRRDRWLYVYLLLEFQSTVDPFMAMRILTYLAAAGNTAGPAARRDRAGDAGLAGGENDAGGTREGMDQGVARGRAA